jgi:alpha-L-fucosidase 2
MCLNLWEHYEFTADRDYLREIYPVLVGSCRFLLDYLCEAPDGYLTTSPSNSPENSFYYTEPDGTRRGSMLTQGATIDFEIIYALFTRTAYACGLLGDTAFADELKAALDRLPPLRVSEKYGILCEWIRDYDECEPGHRHVSPLFGLYPADQINETDPTIFEAARNTLTRRLTYGGEGGAGCHKVGWSQAWMVNFFARFKDGEAAFERVQGLLQNCTADNLLDFHPPQLFQIDGNLGGAAGMAEMLVQSHLGSPDDRVIELLPALPKAWHTGRVKGIKARGNITLDMAWRDGKLTEVTLNSPADREVTVRMPTNGQTAACKLTSGRPFTLNFD